MPSSIGTDIERARQAAETGELDLAYKIANAHLKRDPNDPEFLTIMVHSMLQAEKTVVAYSMAKHVCELRPKFPNAWLNLGKAAADLWQTNEAIRCYKKSIKLARNDEEKQLALVNMCAVLIDNGKFDEAEPYARTVLEMDPDSVKARANLGFCQLANRNWKEGWGNYHYSLGSDWRPRNNYFGEKEWDGSEVDKLIIYAEQGIGDVVGFASMIPDAQKKAKRIIFDCDAKLAGLMQRSFPDIQVYGTRTMKQLPWLKEDTENVDASCAVGLMGEFFRPTTESFPGTKYLTADPDRVFMWKSLFESKKKPVIGVSWRGGLIKTAAKHRQWNLEQLLPLFKSIDAHWVSLQYKPAGEEIAAFKEKHPEIDLVEYPHGTLTPDYDDTAAMVEAMDHLVCMQSAVTHLAGALGKPVWVFVPQCSQWRYGGDGEDYVWSKSVRIMRQTTAGEWSEDIERCAKELKRRFSPATRANGQRHHRPVCDRPSA
jgi:tetratricopeptide (TPR) repeat protein